MLGVYRHQPAAGGETALGSYLQELGLLPQQPPNKFKKGQHVQINLEPKAEFWTVTGLRLVKGRGWRYDLIDDKDDRTVLDYPESALRG